MLVTFDSYMLIAAKGADNIYPLKTASHFDVFYFLPPHGAAVFPLKIAVYAAFVNVNAFFKGYPI